MPHTFRKFISCGARVSKDGAAEERFRGGLMLRDASQRRRAPGESLRGSAAMLLSMRPKLTRWASPPQRQRLLVEHRLDRRPRGRNVEPVLRDEVLAVGRDRVDVLHHLEPLEVIVVVQ